MVIKSPTSFPEPARSLKGAFRSNHKRSKYVDTKKSGKEELAANLDVPIFGHGVRNAVATRTK